MSWILTVTRNNLHLTRRAVASFLAQDVGDVHVLVIDNASTDGTVEWLRTQRELFTILQNEPLSVAAAWNRGLQWVYGVGAGHALVCNNDVVLRPDTYRWLLEDGGGFVTAVGADDPAAIDPPLHPPDPANKRPHPDFSCYLICRAVYEKVGAFDENFKIAFVEDQDYHLRMHRAGVHAECIDLPFYHFGSATVKYAEEREVRVITKQAAENRKYFERKYGFAGGSAEYYAQFGHDAPEGETATSPPR